MADDKVTDQNSAKVSEAQRSDGSWPVPGDEGYVVPDGTPQAAKQLEDNRRAAADRAAAGSSVHGAPMATPGPQVLGEQAAAQARADAYSGPTMDERDAGVTESIREGFDAAADKAEKSDQPVTASAAPSDKRNADDSKPQTKR